MRLIDRHSRREGDRVRLSSCSLFFLKVANSMAPQSACTGRALLCTSLLLFVNTLNASIGDRPPLPSSIQGQLTKPKSFGQGGLSPIILGKSAQMNASLYWWEIMTNQSGTQFPAMVAVRLRLSWTGTMHKFRITSAIETRTISHSGSIWVSKNR